MNYILSITYLSMSLLIVTSCDRISEDVTTNYLAGTWKATTNHTQKHKIIYIKETSESIMKFTHDGQCEEKGTWVSTTIYDSENEDVHKFNFEFKSKYEVIGIDKLKFSSVIFDLKPLDKFTTDDLYLYQDYIELTEKGFTSEIVSSSKNKFKLKDGNVITTYVRLDN